MHELTNNQAAIVRRCIAIPSPGVYKMKRMILHPFEKKKKIWNVPSKRALWVECTEDKDAFVKL